MDSEISSATKVPWNKGKIVGQKAPLKLKDIWAIRIGAEMSLSVLAYNFKRDPADLGVRGNDEGNETGKGMSPLPSIDALQWGNAAA